MADQERTIRAWRITELRGAGTSQDDEYGLVHVTLDGQDNVALAFDEGLANHLAGAFMAASSHLLTKRAMRRGPGSTLIPGAPLAITSTTVTLGQAGPERVVVMELKTDRHESLMFSLQPRAAEVLARRLREHTRSR